MTTYTIPLCRQNSLVALAIAVLFTFTGALSAYGQAQEGAGQRESIPDLNRWNVQLSTGTYMGVTGGGATPFFGSLGSRSRFYNPTFGLDVEYMPSIFLGLKAGYVYSVLENRDGFSSYKNNYQMFSLGVNFYLFKLFDISYPLDRINPYVTMRTGYSKSSLSELRDRSDRSAFHGHYGLGVGSRFRINDRVDATAAYHYTFYNPAIRLDGQNRSGLYETQRLAGFTIGLSVKIGSTSRPSARWFTRPRHSAPNIIFI